MEEPLKYPVGIQTFTEIIKEKYIYVDKTQLIYDLIHESKYVFLSRPRRFGKSLLMSTLEAYFRGKKELFSGLAISKLETDWEVYPVFRFDLSPANYDHPQRLINLIKRSLNRIGRVYGLSSEYDDISDIFIDFIEQAFDKYGKRVVVLIDEYDKPLLDCMHTPDLHEVIKNEIRSFYSSIKACDEYIRFAMLTGVTGFGKVSIFSGLNNLKDISFLPCYNALCGISESEFRKDFEKSIAIFARENSMTDDEAWKAFKRLYDGYHFANKGEDIYNPYSVLHAFDDNIMKSYWYATGSSSYLIKLIETYSYRLDKIEGQRRTENQLANITDFQYDFIPLLYQSGYLTIKDYDKETTEYTLGFPNREVYEAFWTSLKNHFFRTAGGGSDFDLRLFTRDIIDGNPEAFMERMKALFADTSSEPERNKEIHFQNMMAIVAKMLGFNVLTEVHSSAGRCDMQILTERYAYIFEFKINDSPEEALCQIQEKGYADSFIGGKRSIFLIGAKFSIEKRNLTEWIIRKV